MAGFGFNTDVRVGGEIYHVQTEPCQRPTTAIETSIFQAGLVQYVRRIECQGADGLEEQVRAQHGAIIAELRSGALRGLGPTLELDWLNAPESRHASHTLLLALRVACGQQPAAACHVRASLRWESGEETLVIAEGFSDHQGRADLQLTLPPAAGQRRAPLRLSLEAERGLCLGRRQFRLS